MTIYRSRHDQREDERIEFNKLNQGIYSVEDDTRQTGRSGHDQEKKNRKYG